MKHYEFTVILSSDEDKMKEGLAFVNGELEKASAEITKQDDLGIKTLAYTISKQDKGHYFYYEINVDSQAIKNMSRAFELSTLVLKFLFVNPEKI
ncbi:MAG TPA: 30S ribosomal protein S6 [Candidatus Ornithospirochaeta avicola]|uniref:Small ribosomal subunit protein bS6 n=1 Tax=Candidatus Ornithospirochaeta avicola TaxID=2840896 RepID=A0A9D1PTF4_9SPIO|nr:30S ribosomal protein S6 [Candidatus Ornithospirochaeta avicola]